MQLKISDVDAIAAASFSAVNAKLVKDGESYLAIGNDKKATVGSEDDASAAFNIEIPAAFVHSSQSFAPIAHVRDLREIILGQLEDENLDESDAVIHALDVTTFHPKKGHQVHTVVRAAAEHFVKDRTKYPADPAWVVNTATSASGRRTAKIVGVKPAPATSDEVTSSATLGATAAVSK